MPRILSLATAVPPHRLDQARAREEMARLAHDHPAIARLVPVFDRSGVDTRYLVQPPEWYLEPRGFEERNREYIARGLELTESAARQCLAAAATSPESIDHIFFVTTTGLATPNMDALLVARLGLRPDVRRWPLFGLGCAGGAGALTRARDLLVNAPNARVLVVSLELCSLVFSRHAMTATDLIGVALFGDGAAAVLLGGDESDAPGIGIAAARTRLFPEARHLMGWNFTSDGMRLVLSRDIPEFVSREAAPEVRTFLACQHMAVDAITHYVLHPGGPKVMSTYRSAFALPEEGVRVARESMRRFGNLSSASVLFMLKDVMESGPAPGDTGLMIALGPGFACEMLLLRW
jgi:alkylresorcinol/alkylpyrone synthase